MNIYFITTKLNFVDGGGSSDEYDLMYRALQKLSNRVTVITAYSKGNKILAPLPYKVIEENVSAIKQLGIQYAVFKLLRKYEHDADMFHVDGNVFLYGAGFYRFSGGKAPVAAYFNSYLVVWPAKNSSLLSNNRKDNFLQIAKNKIRLFVEKNLMMPAANYIDFFEFTNPYLEERYNKFGLHTRGRSVIIGDPFDWPGLMKKCGIAMETYRGRNKKMGPFKLFYVSRMVPGRGFDLLIKAFAKLKNKENFRLVLAGNGPEEKSIQRLVGDSGLARYISLPGYLSKPELYKHLSDTDIYVHPHQWREISSMALLTAMTFGIPSIVPGDGALSWVAKNSTLYFKDGDIDDLAEKIEQLSNDYNFRAELSQQCYERLNEDEQNYQNQMGRVYQAMKKITKKV